MLIVRPVATVLELMKATEDDSMSLTFQSATICADTGMTTGILCGFNREPADGPCTNFHMQWHIFRDEEEVGADIKMQTYDLKKDLREQEQGLWPEIRDESLETVTVNWSNLAEDELLRLYRHCQIDWSLEMD